MEADGKIVPRSMAYTHDGKLPSIPDKLSTILEECRREVTPRRAHVSSKTDNLPGIKGNVEPLQIESANSSGLAVEKNDETRPSRYRRINGTSRRIISTRWCAAAFQISSTGRATKLLHGDARCYIRQINGKIDGYHNGNDRAGLNYSATRF